MFPLVDHRGRVVGFGGRTLKDETPKYLNSPEGPLYQKGHLLYGLYQARRAIAEADEVVVVEGYTDVLGLAQAGVTQRGRLHGDRADRRPDRPDDALHQQRHLHVRRRPGGHRGHAALGRAGARPLAASHGGRAARRARSGRRGRAGGPGGRSPRCWPARCRCWGSSCAQALDRGDTSTADGRVRAFEEVRRIMDRAVSLKEREEEIPMVADRLRLSADSVALLLRGRRRPPAAARPRRRREPGAGAGAWPSSAAGQRGRHRARLPGGGGLQSRPGRGRAARRSLRSTSPIPATARSSWGCARRSPLMADAGGPAGGAGRPAGPGSRRFRGRAASSCAWSWRPTRSAIPRPCSRSCTCGCRSSTSGARSAALRGALGRGRRRGARRSAVCSSWSSLLQSVRASLTNLDPEEGRS